MDRYFNHLVGLVVLYLLYRIISYKRSASREGFVNLSTRHAEQLMQYSDQLGSGKWEGDLVINGDLEVFGDASLDSYLIMTRPTSADNWAEITNHGIAYGHRNAIGNFPVMLGGAGEQARPHWYSRHGDRLMVP